MSLASPKSQILTILPWERRTFLAARSRCTHCKKRTNNLSWWKSCFHLFSAQHIFHFHHSYQLFLFLFIQVHFFKCNFILLYEAESLFKHASWRDDGDHWIFKDDNYMVGWIASGCSEFLPGNSSSDFYFQPGLSPEWVQQHSQSCLSYNHCFPQCPSPAMPSTTCH